MIPSAVSENDRTNVLASGTVFRSQRLLPSGDMRSPGRRAERSTTPSLTWRVGGGVAASAAKAAPARFTAAKAQSNDLVVRMRTSLPQTGRVTQGTQRSPSPLSASATQSGASLSPRSVISRARASARPYAARLPCASPVARSASARASWFGGWPGRRATAARACSRPTSAAPGPARPRRFRGRSAGPSRTPVRSPAGRTGRSTVSRAPARRGRRQASSRRPDPPASSGCTTAPPRPRRRPPARGRRGRSRDRSARHRRAPPRAGPRSARHRPRRRAGKAPPRCPPSRRRARRTAPRPVTGAPPLPRGRRQERRRPARRSAAAPAVRRHIPWRGVPAGSPPRESGVPRSPAGLARRSARRGGGPPRRSEQAPGGVERHRVDRLEAGHPHRLQDLGARGIGVQLLQSTDHPLGPPRLQTAADGAQESPRHQSGARHDLEVLRERQGRERPGLRVVEDHGDQSTRRRAPQRRQDVGGGGDAGGRGERSKLSQDRAADELRRVAGHPGDLEAVERGRRWYPAPAGRQAPDGESARVLRDLEPRLEPHLFLVLKKEGERHESERRVVSGQAPQPPLGRLEVDGMQAAGRPLGGVGGGFREQVHRGLRRGGIAGVAGGADDELLRRIRAGRGGRGRGRREEEDERDDGHPRHGGDLRLSRRGYSRTGSLLASLVIVAAAAAPAPGAPEGRPGAGATAPLLRIEVGDCVLEAPASERGRLEGLARDARTLLPRVEQELGVRAAAPYRITLIPVGPAMDPAVRAVDAQAPPWAAGFIVPAVRAGAIRVAEADRYPYADLSSVLAHEATHMLLYDAAGPGLPRWFGEGVATGIERSWGMRDVLVYSSSILTGRLPPLSELDDAFDASDDRARAAYAASFDFLLWTVITLLALLAGARRRARSRRILEQWQAEDSPPPPDETVH